MAQKKYERPWTIDEISQHYGSAMAKKLARDPVHRWRAETGIELIHKEPTEDEFHRICRNWELMSDRQKKLSDKMSLTLFGKRNRDRIADIQAEYDFENSRDVYRELYGDLSDEEILKRIREDNGLLEDETILHGIAESSLIRRLDEGYFKSAKPSVLVRNISKILDKSSIPVERGTITYSGDLPNSSGAVTLRFQSVVDYSSVSGTLNSLLNQCGWYVATENDSPRWYVVRLESKFPVDSDDIESFSKGLICKYGTFYHVTFKKYLKSILRNGLQPSFSSRAEFFHPERVYLFTDCDEVEDFIAKHAVFDKITRAYKKSRYKGNDFNGDFRSDFLLGEEDMYKFAILNVDLERAVKDGKKIELYHDCRYPRESSAYFTPNSINPKYFIEYKVYD